MMAGLGRFVVSMVVLAGLVSAQTVMSLMDVLNSNNNTLSTLRDLLQSQPTLLSALESSTTPMTILAPNNDGFSKFLASPAGMNPKNHPDLVAALLSYHVLNGTYPSSAITGQMQFVNTLLTNQSFTNVTGGQVVGVVSSGKGDGMRVEVMSGLGMMSKVTMANVNYTNGIIHVIDTPLTIPLPPSTTAVDSELTSLAGALTTSNLVSAVDSLKDVTIFAPSNKAFSNIGSALQNITMPQLSQILEYHVINGTIGYSPLLVGKLANQSFPTLMGEKVEVEVLNGTGMGMEGMNMKERVFVDSAEVVKMDVLVSNGVVHVIDNVLNPSSPSATPNPTASTQQPAFSGASSISSAAPFTSGISATTTAPSASTATAGGEKMYGTMGVGALLGGIAGAGVLGFGGM